MEPVVFLPVLMPFLSACRKKLASETITSLTEIKSCTSSMSSVLAAVSSDLPTRSTQSFPLQQMFSQFRRLSTSGTHTASDVCFVLQNGDTLFACRGFLAVACPEMLPFLYNSEGE